MDVVRWSMFPGHAVVQPGDSMPVIYHGMLMTPEELGNYTYGFIGRTFNFSLQKLFVGSFVAAGFPTSGEKLENEFEDRASIELGYNAAEPYALKPDYTAGWRISKLR